MVPTAPTPSTTTPLPSHTSRSKTRPVFLSLYVDLFDEPNFDSTEATLLDKDESDPSPSPSVKSPSNFLGTKKTLTRVNFKFPMSSSLKITRGESDSFHPTLEKGEPDPSPSPTVKSTPNLLRTKRTFTRVHSTFPEDYKKLIIEEKDVNIISSTQHSTIGNHQPIPPPKPVHSPDICPSPDDPPQDVDKSHLSDSTSTSTTLNETCSLDTSCDHLLHLDSPSLSSELQDTSSVESVEIQFVSDFEETLESNKFSPTDVSSVHMTMIVPTQSRD